MSNHPAHTFDSLSYATVLKEAGCDPKLAETQASEQAKIVEMLQKEYVVTKQDIRRFEQIMHKEGENTRREIAEIHKEIAKTHQKIAESETRTQKSIADLQSETQKSIAEVYQKIAESESKTQEKLAETQKSIADLRAETQKATSETQLQIAELRNDIQLTRSQIIIRLGSMMVATIGVATALIMISLAKLS